MKYESLTKPQQRALSRVYTHDLNPLGMRPKRGEAIALLKLYSLGLIDRRVNGVQASYGPEKYTLSSAGADMLADRFWEGKPHD